MTKIKYDSDNKITTINTIRNCVHDIDDINNNLLHMNIPYDFEKKNILDDIKISVKESKKILNDYKNNFSKYVDNINNDELEILSQINKIEDIIIDELDL